MWRGYYFTGLTLYQLNQLEQAVSSFQKALDKQPEHVQSRLLLAQTFLKQGRVDDSIQAAQAVLNKASAKCPCPQSARQRLSGQETVRPGDDPS